MQLQCSRRILSLKIDDTTVASGRSRELEFQEKGPGSGIPAGGNLDEFASSISERERGVSQQGSKRLDGGVTVLFRRGSFLSSRTGILLALDPIKTQSGGFFVRLLALKWILVALAFTLPFGNLKKCFY